MPGIMVLNKINRLYSPKKFWMGPNLPESNARVLARYFSLWASLHLCFNRANDSTQLIQQDVKLYPKLQ